MKDREYISRFCTGCGLCHSFKKTPLTEDYKGFPVVKINKEEKDLSFFKNVCPVFYYKRNFNYSLWGNVEKAVIGYSSDSQVRFKASTGGALTETCSFLLKSGEVDGIIHTTYKKENPTQTRTVISYTREELLERCGSRYSISCPLENLFETIDVTKRYAFVGKPCDVMALRRFLDVQPKYKSCFKYFLSFFCAGEPSSRAQEELLKGMGLNGGVENCVHLTYRGNGWPGETHAIDKNGRSYKLKYKETWGAFLGRDLRNICRFCLDGTGEMADIVCADFWYLDSNGHPDFEEHDGRNIIICRNKRGEEIIKKLIESKMLVCEEDFSSKISELKKYQPAQFLRKCTMKSVIKGMTLLLKKTPNYCPTILRKNSKEIDGKTKRRYFVGIIKRVIKKQI